MLSSDSSGYYLSYPTQVAFDVVDFSHLIFFDNMNGAKLYRHSVLIERIEHIRSLWNLGKLDKVCDSAEQLKAETVTADNLFPELSRGLGNIYLGCCRLRRLSTDEDTKAKAEAAKARTEEAKAKAKELKAKAEEAGVEAGELKAKAEEAGVEAEKAKLEAEKAGAEAEKAKSEAEKAKSEAEKAKSEAEKAGAKAKELKTKAEEAGVEAEKAKLEAEKAGTKAKELKAKAEEARAEVEKAEAPAKAAGEYFEVACGCFGDGTPVPLLKAPALLGLAAVYYKVNDKSKTLTTCEKGLECLKFPSPHIHVFSLALDRLRKRFEMSQRELWIILE